MLFGIVVFSIGCKKDDDPVGCNYLTEVQNEANALSTATTEYGNDPTPAKCQAWKDAYQNYLNALEDNVECAALSGDQAELQAAIDQAQASLDSIQCQLLLVTKRLIDHKNDQTFEFNKRRAMNMQGFKILNPYIFMALLSFVDCAWNTQFL